jgi:hypothetical protein
MRRRRAGSRWSARNDHDGYADAAGDGTSLATHEPDFSSAAHDSIVFRRRSQSAYGP